MLPAHAKATVRLLAVQRHIKPFPNLASRFVSSTQSGLSQAARDVLSTRKSINILDSNISYLDTGVGDNAVIFLHGNPTSAFLWRNVIPHVQPVARCLAPDLIGMGHSGKLDIEYTFDDHYRYLSAWIDEMKLPQKVNIVCHDWGSALGFHWCNQHRDRVQSITFMEAITQSVPNWDKFLKNVRFLYQGLRSRSAESEEWIRQNMPIESILPGNIMRQMTDEEMDEYRAPYPDVKSRLPIATWCREVPVASEGPANVVNIVNEYNAYLASSSSVPKLYIDSDPGLFSVGIRKWVKNWPNQHMAKVKGLHFIQEDSPDEIGTAITNFLKKNVFV